MNPENTVEYNSLSWVKAQLDDVLSDAQSSLNEYIENNTDAELENCIEHLQLIFGTLQMVEVYGAAMLAEEMQLTTTALLEGNIDRAEDSYDVLMRAMLQLPDYLEGIQAGKKDAPISLMPLINDLRAARKEGLLTESVLFSPDVESADLTSRQYDAATIESGRLQSEAKRLRTHYQLGLLDYIRNNKQRAGLQRIKAVLHSLEKVSSEDEVRRLWMVAGALVEGLLKEGIESNLSIKMLLGAIDRQLKLILDIGEEEFAGKYSKELVKNALYYIGMCTVNSEAIDAVKEAYQLSDLIPQESEEHAAIGGLNADLFDTVSKGITEDLVQVKDVLEMFMQNNEQDMEQLVPVAEQLGKIGDTYGMLGMGATRQSIMDQRGLLEGIIKGETQIDEGVVLSIASELLNAESELKDYIDTRSGFVDMNRGSDEQTVPAAEYRQVVHAVVSEGLKNFSDAKEAILSYISGIGDKEQLDIILNRLEEVRGVSMMLPLGRVEALIGKLQRYIRVALLKNNHQAEEAEQDTVADVVTAIEYFFEALSEGRPGVEQGLTAGETAAMKLDEVSGAYSEVTDVDNIETFNDVEEPVELEEQVVPQDADSDDADAEKKTPTLQAVPDAAIQETTEYAILADDADDEIVEIFIEEAVEVLGELHEYLPQWKADSNDEEALAVVRRSFHTLKGSGRLLGAEMIGEFSWKFENMLNRVIEKKVTVSPALFDALDEALAVLPQLIEQLKGNREPVENIEQLMLCADTLAEGGEFTLSPPADSTIESDSEAVEVAEDATTIEVEDGIDIPLPDESVSVDEVLLEAADETVGDFITESEGSDEIVLETVDMDDANRLLDEVSLEDTSDSSDAIEVVDVATESEMAPASTDDDLFEEATSTEHELSVDAAEDDTDVIDLGFSEDIDAEESIVEEGVSPEVVIPEEDSLEKKDDGSEGSEADDLRADEFEIIIEEDVEGDGDELDIDPMLLKIYHDESLGYVDTIKQLIYESETRGQPLQADKNLIRAFHTLYGSARTAEVEAISELSGAAEKYVKARQDGGDEDIPEEAVDVLKEIEREIDSMLAIVSNSHIPASNKELQDRINRLVQDEIQAQLQKSWRENAAIESELLEESQETVLESVDLSDTDLSAVDEIDGEFDTDDLNDAAEGDVVDVDTTEVEKTEAETATVDESAAAGSEEEASIELSYGDIDDELIDIFLEEAEELLESCEDTINEIKAAPNATEHVHHLQRSMHTLKGGARMADLTPVGDLTHNLESLVVMVNESKVAADKTLFDLLHESLDTLTGMLSDVKHRKALTSANRLNERIKMLMRGEVEEKRSVERYDLEVSDLEKENPELDALEDIDISHLLPPKEAVEDIVPADTGHAAEDIQAAVTSKVEEPDKKDKRAEDRPRWGERATDVNYKDTPDQVRVRSDLLNNLVNYAGEVNIYHARMGKQITDFGFNLAELTQTVVRLKEQLRKLEIETEIQIRSGYETETDNYDDDFDPLEMDQYSTLQQLTRSLSETAGDVESINEILAEITRDSETLLLQESRVSTDLQEGLMRTRMVRFGGLSSRLRRIVRQVSRELDKEVEVEIHGENSEVDRTVLDRIIAPLEHMLRNAVAHGIERPDERRRAGKKESGKIVIDVGREGTDVVINIKDDGAGIDVAKIREKAIRSGLITEDTKVSDHDALQFILQSGFSTADEVTQVSGRGVGMDVVDSEIKQLGGVLDIDTIIGQGTQFNIRLPLTLAINQALLVSASDDVFAVPLASIEGVVRMTGHELQRFYDSGNSHYEFNNVEYELKHLGGLLTGHQQDYTKHFQLYPVLLVKVGDQHFALHVDDMLGRREIVVKPVGMQIGAVRGIAGATILADGRVVLILEMSALVMAESMFRPQEEATVEEPSVIVDDSRKTIMVVDDSITIRKITERMLKRYGIDVVLAKDGVDATNQLQEQVPDLMLLDIEMPRMDGFEVASYVRNDERLKDIPIIMITSRTGTKHKEKAMEIGVNEYLGKPFQEDELVKDINKILKTSY